jgi:hypothetical protein
MSHPAKAGQTEEQDNEPQNPRVDLILHRETSALSREV